MAIPEAILDGWSNIGAIQQSAATYETIRAVLKDRAAPYSGRSFDVFLQGSYGNHTNIRTDSDVDIVIWTDAVFYYDVQRLQPAARANFENAFPGAANYTYDLFKAEVVGWLQRHFGRDVTVGSKAIRIEGNGGRRDADVLVAAEHRQYWDYGTPQTPRFSKGIVFWTADGTKIVNYPKQHLENCTTKHQATASWFKQSVRVLKNMRNSMIRDGALADGVAPSYYLEGLLSNAPNHCFGHTHERTFLHWLNYLKRADQTTMTCANGIHYLVRDDLPVCWPVRNFNTFMTAVERYWNDYRR